MARLPPLETLRVFEVACRHGSYTEAARELHVTHSAVSQRIRQLEEELGLTLFERRFSMKSFFPFAAPASTMAVCRKIPHRCWRCRC